MGSGHSGATSCFELSCLTETRSPPEFAQSLPSSPLNQLRQEVNDQKSLGGLVRKENKGQNLQWEVGGCES